MAATPFSRSRNTHIAESCVRIRRWRMRVARRRRLPAASRLPAGEARDYSAPSAPRARAPDCRRRRASRRCAPGECSRIDRCPGQPLRACPTLAAGDGRLASTSTGTTRAGLSAGAGTTSATAARGVGCGSLASLPTHTARARGALAVLALAQQLPVDEHQTRTVRVRCADAGRSVRCPRLRRGRRPSRPPSRAPRR